MKKISVMIVDDEKLVLEDLSTLVDWEEMGFRIVAKAVNGKQALAKFNEFHPQIVFTDIRMPFMDGIELIRRIREVDKRVQILLLTAYEDFAYAKSAIECGITEYIIKSTINEQNMRDILIRLKNIVDKQEQVGEIIKEREITDFFNNNTPEGGAEQDKQLFTAPYFYFIIEQAVPLNLSGEADADLIKCRKKGIVSVVLDNTPDDYGITAYGNIMKDQLLFVVQTQENSDCAVRQILLHSMARISLRLKETLDADFNIYIISMRQNIITLKDNFIYLLKAFPRTYFDMSGKITDLSEYVPGQDIRYTDIVLDKEKIRAAAARLNDSLVRDYIENLYREIIRTEDYNALSAVSKELYVMLKQLNLEITKQEKRADISFQHNWRMWTKAQSIREWMIRQFLFCIQEKKEENSSQYSKPIIRAMEFIYKNYGNSELTISDISECVGLSTGHLCVLFKKETGKTLNSFISEVRIGEAKRLLEARTFKVYEVSAAVGFQSSQYFSQVFHKYVGMYPNEYQKGQKKE